jgi:predicted CoA-binding protein
MTKAPPGSRAAVMGASPNEDRYSFKAVRMLKEHGYQPIPVHPKGHAVDGVPGLKSLTQITDPVDTVTVYVNAGASSAEYERILGLKPRRVIFNPGAENGELAQRLRAEGIEIVEACTLVMLRTQQY